MTRRHLLWGSAAAAGVFGAIGGAWLLSLPPAPPYAPPPLSSSEAEALRSALKPTKRQRPLIAVIGINDATEVTDYLMPYGILRRADVADVVMLATGPGPVTLFPALTVEPDATIEEFDARHPDGADYVLVPAMSRDDDPRALRWLTSQAARGAFIVGVCAGAKVVAAAGLLDGRRATTHWYYREELLSKHPDVRYVADRRIVVEEGVATTTGITASIPMALTLVEAIAGHDTALAVAEGIGLETWDARHDSSAFAVTRPFAMTAIRNSLAIWNHEVLGIELAPGIDEVSLALVADAWSRTYRSRAVTFAPTAVPRQSRNGLRIVPDRVATRWPEATRVASVDGRPADVLDATLRTIAARYGPPTARFVAMQLEYPVRRPFEDAGRARGSTAGAASGIAK